MARIIVVDDSRASRTHISHTLRDAGYDVEEFAEGIAAAASALAQPPLAVVTDYMMEKMSGIQLCRLLRAERETEKVPIVLLTAAKDQRSRFWASSAGATAYVTKDDIATLPGLLKEALVAAPPPLPGRVLSRDAIEARMWRLMDSALFESVIAGDMRGLASSTDLTTLFERLTNTLRAIVHCRWVALATESGELLVDGTSDETTARGTATNEARAALGACRGLDVRVMADAPSAGGPAPIVVPIGFDDVRIGSLAAAFGPRGGGSEERRLLCFLASELASPLRIVELMAESRRQASTDALTGLLNRRALTAAMERERALSRRHGLPFSLLLLDVDHFKKCNDTYGHAAGDAVLKGVGGALTRLARSTDYVARWGGEELVVALPHTGTAGARVAAERIRAAVAATTHVLSEGTTVSATVSIGVVSAQGDWDFDDLVSRADRAMYAAKARGRNRVESAPDIEDSGLYPLVTAATRR